MIDENNIIFVFFFQIKSINLSKLEIIVTNHYQKLLLFWNESIYDK